VRMTTKFYSNALQDYPLAQSANLMSSFPRELTKYGWNGAPLPLADERCNPEDTALCPNHPFKHCRGDLHMVFSIGVGRGVDFAETIMTGPIMTGNDVTDCRGLFVADPFLVVHLEVWYVFAEVWFSVFLSFSL
jgi:hypothetical protein